QCMIRSVHNRIPVDNDKFFHLTHCNIYQFLPYTVNFSIIPANMATKSEMSIGLKQEEISKLRHAYYKPHIMTLSGLPGTGKSALARILEERSDYVSFDVDTTRISLFGYQQQLPPNEERHAMEQAYEENHNRAKKAIQSHQPVILAATYSRD